jgi:hypothetical protein
MSEYRHIIDAEIQPQQLMNKVRAFEYVNFYKDISEKIPEDVFPASFEEAIGNIATLYNHLIETAYQPHTNRLKAIISMKRLGPRKGSQCLACWAAALFDEYEIENEMVIGSVYIWPLSDLFWEYQMTQSEVLKHIEKLLWSCGYEIKESN